MNEQTQEHRGLKLHPAAGWISMIPIPGALRGTVEQPIDEEKVQALKQELEDHPLLGILNQLGNAQHIDEDAI